MRVLALGYTDQPLRSHRAATDRLHSGIRGASASCTSAKTDYSLDDRPLGVVSCKKAPAVAVGLAWNQ
jgi:hypothetical protein